MTHEKHDDRQSTGTWQESEHPELHHGEKGLNHLAAERFNDHKI